MAYCFVKETAKRPQALEANFEAHIRNAQVRRAQKFFGLFNATLDEILVRCFIKCLPEKS